MFYEEDFTTEELNRNKEVYISFTFDGFHEEHEILDQFLKKTLRAKETNFIHYELDSLLYIFGGNSVDKRSFSADYLLLKKFTNKKEAQNFWDNIIKESELRKSHIGMVCFADSKAVEEKLAQIQTNIFKQQAIKEEKVQQLPKFLSELKDSKFSIFYDEIKKFLESSYKS